VKGSYRKRHFASLDWSGPEGEALPSDWPRSIDLSAVSVSMGLQIRYDKKK